MVDSPVNFYKKKIIFGLLPIQLLPTSWKKKKNCLQYVEKSCKCKLHSLVKKELGTTIFHDPKSDYEAGSLYLKFIVRLKVAELVQHHSNQIAFNNRQ